MTFSHCCLCTVSTLSQICYMITPINATIPPKINANGRLSSSPRKNPLLFLLKNRYFIIYFVPLPLPSTVITPFLLMSFSNCVVFDFPKET